jgi:two-component system, OmpR family, response regulator MprA
MYIYNEKESKQQKRWHTMNEALTPIGQENQPQLKVLVIDDEENIIELIKLGLKYEGFQVESASDGSEGLAAAQRIDPNVIILDLMLPGMDGLEVMRQLRMNPTTRDIPVLMLTAKDEVQDRVTGLKTGADDYLAKPFSFEEFVARIRAILRRQKRSKAEDGTDLTQSQILQFGDLQLNPATREVTRAGRPIDLTVTEYNLLYLFMSHPREVLDRKTILNRVWGYDFLGETNIIEVYVRYLREKIEDTPSTPHLIQTVRGVGYVLKG